MERLREIGYLDYTAEIQQGRTKFFCILPESPVKRRRMMRVRENPLPPSPAEKSQSGDWREKLALLEKLGITLDDLEKLFKSR